MWHILKWENEYYKIDMYFHINLLIRYVSKQNNKNIEFDEVFKK